MSGDKVWVHGAVDGTSKAGTADAISGETILGFLAQNKTAEMGFSLSDMFFGFIPGSVGETSTLLILLGGLYLVFTKIASWRIMLSATIGALAMGLLFNAVVDFGWIQSYSKFYSLMAFDFWKHLIVGGLAFGIVYMATDPVTSSQTNKGKWIYGFLVGFISVMIRVFNPGYPEGVFLAILLMNVFAPTIDYYVVQGNVKRRLKRAKQAKIYPASTPASVETQTA
jgi:Na+-transporting NADH:ubiquinone oxidoreductase subunit B